MEDHQERRWKRATAWREEHGISAATLWRWAKSGRVTVATIGNVCFVDELSFQRAAEAAIVKAVA